MAQSKKPVILIKSDVEKILELCAHDGHSIIPSKEFVGVNPEFIKAVEFKHKSSKSDPKWMISTASGPVKELTGIYTLDALSLACGLLSLESEAGHYFGRGRQASAYTDSLQKWIATQA